MDICLMGNKNNRLFLNIECLNNKLTSSYSYEKQYSNIYSFIEKKIYVATKYDLIYEYNPFLPIITSFNKI